MNTNAEFHELLMQSNDEALDNKRKEMKTSSNGRAPGRRLLLIKNDEFSPSFEGEFDEPSLTSSETSCSSLDDLWSTNIQEGEPMREEGIYHQPHHVSFHPYVEVREYSLTLSEHPCCDDQYPISLDWAFADPCVRHIETSKTRDIIYSAGLRLSADERRRRLAEVLGCDEEDVDAMAHSLSNPLGRSILAFVAQLLPTIYWPNNVIKSPHDEEDDEFTLLYGGTTRDSSVVEGDNKRSKSSLMKFF